MHLDTTLDTMSEEINFFVRTKRGNILSHFCSDIIAVVVIRMSRNDQAYYYCYSGLPILKLFPKHIHGNKPFHNDLKPAIFDNAQEKSKLVRTIYILV